MLSCCFSFWCVISWHVVCVDGVCLRVFVGWLWQFLLLFGGLFGCWIGVCVFTQFVGVAWFILVNVFCGNSGCFVGVVLLFFEGWIHYRNCFAHGFQQV